jgi:hypothetical protein
MPIETHDVKLREVAMDYASICSETDKDLIFATGITSLGCWRRRPLGRVLVNWFCCKRGSVNVRFWSAS